MNTTITVVIDGSWVNAQGVEVKVWFAPPCCPAVVTVSAKVVPVHLYRRPILALLFLFGGVRLVAVACAGDDSSPTLTLGGPHEYHGAYLLPPLARPNFTLTDTSGQTFAFEKATHGQITLLFFGYTNCPDVCPTTMADIAAGLKQLPPATRDAVKVVFVTTDPRRDEAAVLRKWLDHFDPSFIGLTGAQATINTVMESLRLPGPAETEVTADGYTVTHISDVLLFTPDDIAHLVYVGGAPAADWAADLTKLVKQGFKKPKS